MGSFDRAGAPPARLSALAVFLVVVVGGGLLIGLLNTPGAWYSGLVKPSFNPPAFVFGPVWTVLYVAIALSGWRIWRVAPKSGAMWLWGVQLLLNWLWSPAFFGLEMPALGLVVILPLLVAILAFIVVARRIDRPAAWLFVPYAAWVGFATVLNASIVALN